MKVSVTRQDALYNISRPPRPLVVDTEALAPDEAAELSRLAAAAHGERAVAPSSGPAPEVEIVIEDGGAPQRITAAEGSLSPATAALVDAVSRLAR